MDIKRKNNKSLLGANQELSIEALLNIKRLQELQDKFSAVTEVGIRIIDSCGKPITSHSKEPRLCSELFKDPRVKSEIGGPCLPTFLGGKEVINKNLSFICQAGLHHFIAPLAAGRNQLLGYVILGPVILVMRKPKEEYRRIAEKLDIDLEDFWSAILEVKTISFHGAQSLIELIRDIGEYTIRLAYKNMVNEKGREAMMAPESPDKLNRLLDALLDVAFEISGANIGSIMLLDKLKKNLTIQASRGIPPEIVRKTRVGLGEGIAGIAVREKRPFFIDDKSADNRISSYLKRPYLTSSMVLPFEANRITGVMNLATSTASSVKLDANSQKLMNKLINLASAAIE